MFGFDAIETYCMNLRVIYPHNDKEAVGGSVPIGELFEDRLP